MRQIKLITTTNSVEGWLIEKYFGIVTNQVVIGTDLFKDIFASWRDVFGGNVKSYQKELEKLENIALDELKKKASQKGANVIIGLRLDFDEISGSGKSMFMLTATGTAVFATNSKNTGIEQYENTVSIEQLNYEKNRHKILNDIECGDYSIRSVRIIDELINYKIEAIKPVLGFLDSRENVKDDFENNKNIYFEYFKNISHEAINAYIQSEDFLSLKRSSFQEFLKILDNITWFDFKAINALLDSKKNESHQRAIYLLLLKKSNYAIDDAKSLKNIAKKIETLYSTYPKLIEVKGVFGKEKQKWECPNCQKQNSLEDDVCLREGCATNKFGFRKPHINPLERINILELEAQIIEKLLIGT